jgi:hypothetical protein
LVKTELLEALTLVREEAGPFFSRLRDDLRQEAIANRFGGDYGHLIERDNRLLLSLAPYEPQQPADRPRARLIGGTVFGEPE